MNLGKMKLIAGALCLLLLTSQASAGNLLRRASLKAGVITTVAACSILFLGFSGYDAYEDHQRQKTLQQFREAPTDVSRAQLLAQLMYKGRVQLIDSFREILSISETSYKDSLFALKWMPIVGASIISERDVDDSELQEMYIRVVEIVVEVLNRSSIQANPLQLGTLLENLDSFLDGTFARMWIVNLDQAKFHTLDHAPQFRARMTRLHGSLANLQWLLLKLAENAESLDADISIRSRLSALRLLTSNVFEPEGLRMQENDILYTLLKSDEVELRKAADKVIQIRIKASNLMRQTRYRN